MRYKNHRLPAFDRMLIYSVLTPIHIYYLIMTYFEYNINFINVITIINLRVVFGQRFALVVDAAAAAATHCQ